jgi:hypothetical protein
MGPTWEQRGVQKARQHLAAGEVRLAQLTLEQSLQVNSRDFESMRLLADFYCQAGVPRGMALWREAVRLEPENDENKLGLTGAALRANDRSQAERALASVATATRNTAHFLRLEAALAQAAGDTPRLARALQMLEATDPTDVWLTLNRALLQLHSRTPAEAAAARETLIGLARGGPTRIRATLELIQHGQRSQDPGELARLATAVLPPLSRAAQWRAFILVGIADPGLLDLVEHMKQDTAPRPTDALLLAQWMRRQGLARDALLWLEGLSAGVGGEAALAEEAATAAAQVRDWRRLQRLLKAGAWGPVTEDVLLLAFGARLQREQGAAERSAGTWRDAVRNARDSLGALRVLVRLAVVLEWPAEIEATLWTLVRLHPGEREAWTALAAGAEAEGSADKLVDVLETWSRLQPFDEQVRADLLLVKVLLNRAPPQSVEPASHPNRPAPALPAAIAAQAMMVARLGRPAEAAGLLASLPAAGAATPRVALARAFVLAESGATAPALAALALAARVRLLPAEQALLEQVRKKCGAPAAPKPQGTS